MSETKEFKNGNGERPENENQETTEQEEGNVEGYPLYVYNPYLDVHHESL